MSNIPDLKITDEGIVAPTYQEVLDGVLEDLNQAFGGAMDKDVTTPQGQIAVSMAYAIDQKNQQIMYMANQFDPNYAEGRFQDALGAIYFLTREAATGTAVTARCTGIAGTVIPSGSSAIDDNGNIYYSKVDRAIGASGYVDIVFTNKTTGAIACPAGALNKIYKAISGWDSVINLASGSLGQDKESRNNFEYRRKNSVAANSQNQNLSIQAAVLAVSGVNDSYVYSNDTGSEIKYGETNYPIADHSIVVSVYGGDSDSIAQAIFSKKSAGCGMVGNTEKVITVTENYSEPYPKYTIRYLVPTATEIRFRISLESDDLLPSDIVSQIKTVVTSVFTGETGSSRARICGIIHSGRYYSPISDLSNYVNINSIEISKNGVDYSTSVKMGIDEMPVISSANIEVNL